VHRGHDVQQVRDVAAVAPSEEVIGRPRHCALGVVAVVDRDDDRAVAAARLLQHVVTPLGRGHGAANA